ncbi:redoxin domain-containing protein [Proteobacteria bacterium 005FR1]|nr:redoxin domain-containing protein [Proteobacteria bacterium 005FR1]
MLSGRRSKSVLLLLTTSLFTLSNPTFASERVGNFVLFDQHGKSHELHYHKDAEAIVLMAHSTSAKDSAKQVKALQKLSDKFASEKVKVFLLNADSSDSRETVRAQTEKLGLQLPAMMDEGQLIAETLDLTKAGQVLVIDPATWQMVYRGPVDQAGKTLQQMADGDTPKFTEVNMPAKASDLPLASAQQIEQREQISYSDTIAPMLMDKCVACHRPEGIGPWAMTSYTMIKGFAPMIREVVMTKRMPPWHADPHVNEFADDISLSLEQKQTLVHWIDAGAPRGKGADPLEKVGPPKSEWVLGEPDLVVEMPSFDVPATGVLDYQFFEVSNPYPKDVWVKAVQIIPGDPKVVHHAIATFGKPEDPSRPVRPASDGNESNSILQDQLMTFVPGNEHYIYPEETGLLLPKGSSFFTQMHYTTSGKATTDKTKIGLWFREDAPEHVLRHYVIANTEISIPPQEGRHQEGAYVEFHEDAVIYSLFPHAHYRGHASEFAVRWPDGREELVLSVPNYDFNWQRYFRLQEPLEVTAGTKLIHRTTYDNSPMKDSNPDPSLTIGWGLQSWDEMLYGGVSFRYKNADAKAPDILQFRTDIVMGMLDFNIDGKLVADEMVGETGEQLKKMAVWFDADKSGGLELAELKKMFVTMAEEARKRRAKQEQASN